VARIQDLNFRSREVISREILNSLAVKDAEHRFTVVRAAIVGHFTQLLAKTRGTVAQSEARRAWNAAAGFSK
jgi:glutaredoxin 2